MSLSVSLLNISPTEFDYLTPYQLYLMFHFYDKKRSDETNFLQVLTRRINYFQIASVGGDYESEEDIYTLPTDENYKPFVNSEDIDFKSEAEKLHKTLQNKKVIDEIKSTKDLYKIYNN